LGGDTARWWSTPRVVHALDLLQLEPEELHERPVLAVADLLDVSHGRLRHAEALPDVRLRDRARDPIGIGVPAQRNEHVLAARRRQRLRERAGARLGRRHVRGRQTSNRFVHREENCGHGFARKSR
jgi:hypothetical protein